MKRFAFLLFIAASSCVTYGPETEKKSGLNYLNGANYSHELAIPFVAERRERTTYLRGRVVDSQSHIPLRGMHVELKDARGTVLQTIGTNSDGEFGFSGIFANGTYEVVATNQHLAGRTSFEITKYRHILEIDAFEKSPSLQSADGDQSLSFSRLPADKR